MTDSQRRSAVVRKRAKAQGVGGKPTNVKTILKRDQGGDIKIPSGKGKYKVNLFTFDMPKTKYGDNIITAVEDTKVTIDPNLNYNKIYKNNVELDLGISSKGRARIGFKKRF